MAQQLIELVSQLWFLPLLGVFLGLIAGIFGIGGGGLLVPVLVSVFVFLGFDEQLHMHMAIATSLTIIIFNSISAIHTHQQKKAIRWDIMIWIFPMLFIGAYIGASFAASLSGTVLKYIFAIGAILIGVRLYLGGQPPVTKETSITDNVLHSIAGLTFGKLSAMIGIGGGTFVVPYLVWRGLEMKNAVAGGATGGLAIALAASYFNLSHPTDSPPQYVIGFVYIPGVVGIGLVSVVFTRIGAKLAHRVDGVKLKRYFGVFLFLVGVKFLL